jgi:RHS repeat-associated protein
MVDCPLRYPGQYHDPETQLHYNVLRYYDPLTGRYLSNDPIGLAGGDNPHQYVPNPLTWLDPLGLTPGGYGRDAKGRFTGENDAAAAGRDRHSTSYRNALGDGYDYEVRLPSGGRPDAVDWENHVVRELKSDAESSMRQGRHQLDRYSSELEEMTDHEWTTHLDIYKR